MLAKTSYSRFHLWRPQTQLIIYLHGKEADKNAWNWESNWVMGVDGEEAYWINIRVGVCPPDAASPFYRSAASNCYSSQLCEFDPPQQPNAPVLGISRSNDHPIQLQQRQQFLACLCSTT